MNNTQQDEALYLLQRAAQQLLWLQQLMHAKTAGATCVVDRIAKFIADVEESENENG